MKHIHLIIFLSMLVAVSVAEAQTKPWDTIQLDWTDDGNCNDYCPTQGFELETADSPTSAAWKSAGSFGPTARQSMQNNVGEGPHCYRITLLGTGKTLGTSMRSVASNITCKTAVKPATVPTPPTLLVTTGGDVLTAVPNYAGPWPANGWKLGPKVGTIAAKINCDASRRIGTDWYLVKGPVIWTAGRKDYVVARCEAA